MAEDKQDKGVLSQMATDMFGFPVEVVSDEEGEQADAVLCVYAGQEDLRFRADNVYTTCADCGKDITHRPNAPKKPAKLCITCGIKLAEASDNEVSFQSGKGILRMEEDV